MKLWILLVVLIGLVLAALAARFALTPRQHHDRSEYYMGWGGYTHPIGLQHRITKEDADALTADGAAYLIGTFDDQGRLTRVAKFDRGELFFEYLYSYHPNGRLKRATITGDGRTTVLEYDARGRRISGAGTAF